MGVGGGAPVRCAGEREPPDEIFGPFGKGRALELAQSEKAQLNAQPACSDLGEVVHPPRGRRGCPAGHTPPLRVRMADAFHEQKGAILDGLNP